MSRSSVVAFLHVLEACLNKFLHSIKKSSVLIWLSFPYACALSAFQVSHDVSFSLTYMF